MPATASEPAAPGRRRRLRWTLRLRLTLLYGGLFLVCGVALLVITYLLVAGQKPRLVVNDLRHPYRSQQVPPDSRDAMWRSAQAQRDQTLDQLLVQSGIALAIMSVVAVALGWLVAGRALRPVRTMTERARLISDRNLHERLAVDGPDDELKDLGDTFDRLLGRLEAAFAAQRGFVANASHELRTPLTLQRATIEVALADPGRDAASLEDTCARVLAYGEGQERMINALLTLASSERGLEHREPLDLAEVAGAVLDTVPAPGGVRVHGELRPAATDGDPRLVGQLVGNLVDNAVRYNVPGGWVRVSTGQGAGRPALRVVNSGPEVPADGIEAIYRPFQRLRTRTGSPEGHGLGLSIVAAIATAHDAELTTLQGPEGGLDIHLVFPAPRRRPAPD